MEPRAIGAFLDDHKLTFKRDFPLFDYTTFRIGGHADFFVMPQNTRELALLQGFCRQNHVPVFILGGGSNILVSDAGFRGIVIHPDLGEEFRIVEQSASHLRVFVPASARAPLAGKRISALGFQGLEFLTTIPGHFGGSIIQNAGCYGHELKDTVVDVRVVRGGDLLDRVKALRRKTAMELTDLIRDLEAFVDKFKDFAQNLAEQTDPPGIHADAQRAFSEEAAPLRERLIGYCKRLLV